MRDLVKLYFDERSIVNHHIASFNDFLPGPDNNNNRMQRILDDLRVTPNDERGVLRLDPEKTGGKIVEIRFGRKRDEDGNIENDADSTIRVERPKAIEAIGAVEELTPLQARIRNLDYNAEIKVKFTVLVNGQEGDSDWQTVGSMPMMVRSRGCNISREAMEENGKISNEEYEKRLIGLKEDPKDPGGYFIIGGAEKVLITLEDLAPNRIMVERDEKYGSAVETAKIFSQREGYRALTLVQKKKDGIMTVQVPAINNTIPLVALMKALGMESDQEIYNTIVTCDEMANIVYANIEDSMDEKDPKDKEKVKEKKFHTTEDALMFLERNFAAGQAKEYRVKKVNSILDRSLLPHLGGRPEDRMKKAIFLGRIARSVLELSLGKRKEDDKDHYANKRLKLSGDLMEDLFRTSFASFMADFKYQVEKIIGRKFGSKLSKSDITCSIKIGGGANSNKVIRKQDIDLDSAVRRDLLKNRLVHAVATGNWVGGRSGVSQLLDRTSNMSAMSHLRRITSSLTRSQPHFEARDLHPTQWGRLCPSETPEGQNCGLVKNAALIIDVSESRSAEEIEHILRDLGMSDVVVEANSKDNQKTRVYINGDLVGSHDDAKKLVDEIRSRRRARLISTQINIRHDQEMKEVIINCDEGRLRRPLLILKDGRTILSRRELELIREHKMSWNDLFSQGIMEWVDAEEEEDLLIAVDAFDVPVRCEHCGKAISASDVDWMNPGKPGEVILRCKHCNHEMSVESKLTKQHTHMEVDPMAILGVAAGLIPYPEHNSSPRVTLGAAMAKQALGVATGNYRIRPDTRGHLLHYPQKPMVQTQTMQFMKYNERPAGQNFCIAVLSYHGYNIEDALVMNKSSVERGLGRSTFLRTYTTEEEKYGAVQSSTGSNCVNRDIFEIPSTDVVGVREAESYANLDENGIISPEVEVHGRDVLVGKTSPPRFKGEDTNVFDTQKRREASLTVRPGEVGYVDSVLLTESPEGAKLVNIKVRSPRTPEPGDKFCSRHGQKGVIGRLVDQCDMPFTADGITPDLVVNPHGIPSRMTIAHVLEMIGGKVGSMEGRTIDGTVFSGETEESIRDGLVRNGFKHTGKEIMYNGKTGEKIQMDIYTGVIFYEKLHHMVSGKMHMRSRGPMQILTRQPTEGRSRLGGLRFGEMERDCLIGHGVSMVIKDRLLDQSDGRKQYVCGNPNCGHIAVVDSRGARYCPVCKDSTNIHPVETSYAFKLLMDELLSMGVAMRLQLEDLR